MIINLGLSWGFLHKILNINYMMEARYRTAFLDGWVDYLTMIYHTINVKKTGLPQKNV